MKKLILLSLLFVSGHLISRAQDVFIDTRGTTSIHASTPLEDIDATSNQTTGAVNIKNKKVYFKIKMESLVFKRSLMQEHFNENYMESEKFPNGTFDGTIDQDMDLGKDGTYEVTATGDLTIHGVTNKRTIPGTITVNGKSIDITSSFDVKVADHDIKIPTVVAQKIAEVVNVNIHSALVPKEQ
ncbi:MAG: YceI family protein [Chitinophagales bacterium]